MAYQYQPLGDAGAEIRLAVLGPGMFDDRISITFKVQPLRTKQRLRSHQDDDDDDDDDEDPVWNALSYAWGSDKNASHAEIGRTDGAYIPITHNLDIALRHLRHQHRKRSLWIDALCINQSSVEEKSKQVAIMGEIFSQADNVIIWLGPERDSSGEAIAILQHIGHCVAVNWNPQFMTPAIGCPESDEHFADKNTVLPYRDGALIPVLHLFERDYFKRVWIRQEVALATRATIHCGHDKINSSIFKTAVACLVMKGTYYSALLDRQFQEWDYSRTLVYFIFTLRPGSCSYTVLDRYLGNAECRDHRDRIYAMLSLMRASDASIGIQPDYSITTQELYSRAAVGAIQLHRNLELLENCRLAGRTLEIPSWVPDWSVSWQDPNMSTGWSACAWISPSISVLDAKRIRVPGVSVSRIAAIVRADVGEIKDETERCDAVVDVIRKVESCSRKLETDPLPQRIWVDVFCLTATNRRHAEAHEPHHTAFPTFQQYVDVIEAICFIPERLADSDIPFRDVLLELQIAWCNLEFFITTDSLIGLANPGIKEGDQVSVLLGSRFPVVLRPQVHHLPHDPKTWQVVGAAIVGTLMMGEILYRCSNFSRLQGVDRTYGPDSASLLIDGHSVAIRDYKKRKFITDPSQFLIEMGIKVESYRRRPHQLVVLEETLRATGVQLTNFILI